MDTGGAVNAGWAAFMPASITVVGLGNVGSQLVPLLACVTGVERIGLIDCDRYDAANLGFQRLALDDVGRAKAQVQTRILRAMRPDIRACAHACRFEAFPLGLLRDSVVVSCVDSRTARQAINRAAVALGLPWIDAAVSREGSVRARAYLPGHACLECGWGPRDYELLEQRLPCSGQASTSPSTSAPPELGAIAAAMQVSMLRRIFAGACGSIADRQWFLDTGSGRGWTATYIPNPACRLDHARWHITALGSGSLDLPLRDVLALAGPDSAGSLLAAPSMEFIRRLHCGQCRRSRRVHWRLSGRIGRRACECGRPLHAGADDVEEHLGAGNASAAVLSEPLARRGFVAGDLVAVTAGGVTRHFELG
jgi:adenylyltransferase/sulfurtransferase